MIKYKTLISSDKNSFFFKISIEKLGSIIINMIFLINIIYLTEE